MSYLLPPSDASPVVVVKDFGGYVDKYAAQTEIYRRTNREVRIHECHSACTMALGLPNVCVYPTSIFKFHQAYDPRNHVTNWEVSEQLFNTYPLAVRERLGKLEKKFSVLRGSELIQLGVRACGEPQPRIMIAQAKIRPLPESASSSGSTLSMLTGKLQGLVPNLGATPELVPAMRSRIARFKPIPSLPDGMLGPKIPLPPEKPVEIAEGEASKPDESDITASIPLPPPRPKLLVAYTPGLPPIPMVHVIGGAQPILPAYFVPFPRGA